MPTSSQKLRLEWAYGYRGHQCRNNLHYNKHGHLVYFVAGVAVVHDVKNNKQQLYLEHSDDILCLCLDSEKLLAATGQIGKSPFVCIWDTTTLKTICILKEPGHTGGISIVAFSQNSHLFLSVGADENSTLNVWDVKRAKSIARASEATEKVFDAQFHPSWSTGVKTTSAVPIVTCGIKNISFWEVCGNVLSQHDGDFGAAFEPQTVLCLAFGQDGVTYAGTLSGSVLLWQEDELQGEIDGAHPGGVFVICESQEGYCTGGRDRHIRFWDSKFRSLTTIDLSATSPTLWIRAISVSADQFVIGTQNSEIFEISLRDRDKPKCLVNGHEEGELWALATHPKKPVFATGGDDQTVRLWNSSDNKLVQMVSLDQWVRSVDFSPDGSLLAVGQADGSVTIFKVKDLSEVSKFRDRKRPIHELKFSPNGDYLFVGCNDGGNDMYHVSQRFKRVFSNQAATSHVTHLDWAADGKYVQINNGDGDHMIFKIPGCKRVTLTPEEQKSIVWHTFTCTIGPKVAGIWPRYRKTEEINAVDANFKKKLLACGDDFGQVKLFHFPVQKSAAAQKYTGHSAHVTNVRWSHDSQTLISIGGADHAIFQWRLLKAEEPTADFHVNRESDDNEGDSGLDIDSDVERETLDTGYRRAISKPKVSRAMRQLMRKELKEEGRKRKEAPNSNLTLKYVFGYRGYDCHNNIFFTQKGELAYHVAALGILMDRNSGKQRFYIGHTDDILCLSIHPHKDYIATGEVGKAPTIHVWDAETLKPLSILKGSHSAGVCAVDFSGDGRRLASVGLDQFHTIVVWDWKKGEKLAETRGHKDKIFGIRFDPTDHTQLVVVGIRLIKFYQHTGGGFTSTRGVFGKVGKIETMLCVEYGKEAGVCYSGAANGSVYCWKGNNLTKLLQANKGPCFAIFPLEMGFVTGGKDGTVSLWSERLEKCLKTYTISKQNMMDEDREMLVGDPPSVRAVALGHGKIVVGTRNSQIFEIEKNGSIKILVQGHMEGEVWGLAAHPGRSECATVSDDGNLRIWCFSAEASKCTAVFSLGQAARCVTHSSDGKYLAVGFKNGSAKVLKASDFSQVFSFHHRKENISDIRFSPGSGHYLAVGSHDNFVDIYDLQQGKRVGVCKGSSSYITHIDWDTSGSLIQTNSGAREHLFFEAPRGVRQIYDPSLAETSVKWHTWTGVLGDTCVGIWPPSSDVTDVNATCLHPSGNPLATADDFGFVKLFNYPSSTKFAKCKSYLGHSAHVTNVRWSHDGKLLLSVGGADTALLVWELKQNSPPCGGQSDTSDTDSEEEGGYDSDVEQEKNIDYTSKMYAKPLRERLEGTPQELAKGQSHTQTRPLVSRQVGKQIPVVRTDPSTLTSKKGHRRAVTNVQSLKLEYIFGYRGFDCSNNVYYISDGTEIVTHAAGAGIVLNLASGQQRFYLGHSDDILCLTVNQNPRFQNLVATAQIDAQKPCLHIWDAKSLKAVSILEVKHEKGVNCLGFSPSGKYLLSVGMDSDHTISIWKWNDGSLVAAGPGHSNKICDAKFRPDSDNDFVTVGIKHIKFWQLCGGEIVSKKGKIYQNGNLENGVVAPNKMPTMLSIAFAPDGVTYSGCVTGDIYVWKGEALMRISKKAHDGPIFSMFTSLDDGLIVTGAKEKRSAQGACVKLWDQQLLRSRPLPLHSISDSNCHIIKSVCRYKEKIIIGSKSCDIIEIQEQTAVPYFVLHSHEAGELWGLAVHPNKDIVASASCDSTLRLWDVHKKVMLSKLRLSQEGVCVHFSPDGGLVACGMRNGEIQVFHAADLTTWGKRRDRSSSVNEIRFSPDGKLLAAGYQESVVDLYDVTKGPSFTRVSYCKSLANAVEHMDFSADSKFLKVSTSKYEISVFKLPEALTVTDEKQISQIVWASWTEVCGPEVYGIWPKDSVSGEVNSADLSHMGQTLATGDDSGFVKLFQFPCREAKPGNHTKYVGHSAHVTNVKFTFDDQYLVSTGGEDTW